MKRSPFPSLLVAGVLALMPAVGFCQVCDEPLTDALIPAGHKVPLPVPPMDTELNQLTKLVQARKAELQHLDARVRALRTELQKLEDQRTGNICPAAKPCFLELLVTRCAEAVLMPMQFHDPEQVVRGTEAACEPAEVVVPPAVEKRLRELEKKVELVEAMQAELAALREQVRGMQPAATPMVPFSPLDSWMPPLQAPPLPEPFKAGGN